jgi:hypothetical protein
MVTDLNGQIDLAARHLNALIRKQQELEALPDLTEYEIGNVICFDAKFDNNPLTFTYVSYKAPDGKWYTTGTGPSRASDEYMRAWIAGHAPKTGANIHRVTSWETI